jgi:uncharacterized protein YbcC (UPF0753/DUF2309 family)
MHGIFDDARALNAQERCRKFMSAPLGIRPKKALAHVEQRAVDLSQVRPELGHATNAAAILGRRAWTRGIFLDRRVLLPSYDHSIDPEGQILTRIMGAAVPVCAGINLEYYFSTVDNERLGAGTKLPHNVTGLVGVMDGRCSDLRTGLPKQMVEIHEPVRLLTLVEAPPNVVLQVLDRLPEVKRLAENGWILLGCSPPDSGEFYRFRKGVGFEPWPVEEGTVPHATQSEPWFRGKREHLPAALIDALAQRGSDVA